jgi:hypothetical protein
MVALRSKPAITTPQQCSRMVYLANNKPTVKVTVDLQRRLPVVLVNQESGEVVTHGLFSYLLGPSVYVLVASPFARLYYIVQGDQCSCPEGEECEHVQEAMLCGAIRNGRLVQITWYDLTPDEKRAAYDALYEIYA